MNAPTLNSLRRRAILAAVVLVPLAGVVAFAASFLLEDEYQSTAKVLPPALYSALARVPIFTNEVTSERMPDQQSVRYQSDIAMSVLRSTPVLDALVKQEDLTRHYATDSVRVARERLLNATRVSAGRDGVIAIQVSDASNARAASIANAYIAGLERYVIELTNSTARARADAIRQQLALAERRLRELDSVFAQVQARTCLLYTSDAADE